MNIMFSVDWDKITDQAYTITTQTCTNLWHNRFGHFYLRSIAKMKKNDLVENKHEFLSNVQAFETFQHRKQTNLPFQVNQVCRAKKKHQVIHMNVYNENLFIE